MIIGIIIIICVGIFFVYSNIFSGDDDDVEIINDNNTFVVGIDSESPPFTYEEGTGNYTGFDLELAREVCDRNGWKLVEKPIVWSEKEDEINSGNVDCVWTSFTINGRENQYTWSEPYVENKQVVIVKKDSGINNLSDLADKVVEVLEGSSSEEVLKNNYTNLTSSFYKLIPMANYRQDFDDLESGVCDAIIMDYHTAMYMVNEDGQGNYKILDQEICSEQFGIGFKKGNTDLRNQVQETLNEMYNDGTVEKIAEHYDNFGVSQSLIYMG